MSHITVKGRKYKIFLEQTDDGVDVCIESIRSCPFICRITNEGKLFLYADVDKTLKRTKNLNKYIKIEREMKDGTD